MSRRNKKHPPVVKLVAPAPGTPPLPAAHRTELTLGEIVAEAEARSKAQDWNGLQELSEMPLAAIREVDRKGAVVPLLLCRLRAMTRHRAVHSIEKDVANVPEFLEVLEELNRRVPDFHQKPEFDLFFAVDRWKVKGHERNLRLLTAAFAKSPNERLLKALRGNVLRLHAMRGDDWDEEFSDEERATLAAFPPLLPLLIDACRSLERSGSDSEALSATVWRLDAQTRSAEPDEVNPIADAIRRLPTPDIAQLYQTCDFFTRVGPTKAMNPLAWAFMWEASRTGKAGWSELDIRYPDRLGYDVADGLKLIIKSALEGHEEPDEQFIRGLDIIARRHQDDREEFSGQFLLLQCDGVTEEMDAGIDVPSARDIVLRLVEHAPPTLRVQEELMTVYHALDASSMFGQIEDAKGDVPELAGLDELAEGCLAFTVLLADVAPHVGQQLYYCLRALRRHIESGDDIEDSVYSISLEDVPDDEVNTAAERLLKELWQLQKVRDRMNPSHLKRWRSLITPLFQYLSKGKSAEIRASVDTHMSTVRKDVLEVNPLLAGQIHQQAGWHKFAVCAYVRALGGPQHEAALSGARAVIQAASDGETLRRILDEVLEQATISAGNSAAVEALLKLAQSRLKTFDKQGQFERTAVTRWPALNPQARKVLSVLDSISSYNGFDELGKYAGMTGEWAGRHYRRLVDEGMVLETPEGYEINPHIKHLVEQESKHAILARIIRTGDSKAAVKQVFNSEREYTIYHAMVQLCPNHLVFPNCGLQSIFSYDRMKELLASDEFSYYLMASVDIVVVSTTTYLPLLAVEVDSVYHDTPKQLERDGRKDRIFGVGGVPLMRLRPVGSPSAETIRSQVAEHVDELVRTVRDDMPGYEQTVSLLQDLTGQRIAR